MFVYSDHAKDNLKYFILYFESWSSEDVYVLNKTKSRFCALISNIFTIYYCLVILPTGIKKIFKKKYELLIYKHWNFLLWGFSSQNERLSAVELSYSCTAMLWFLYQGLKSFRLQATIQSYWASDWTVRSCFLGSCTQINRFKKSSWTRIIFMSYMAFFQSLKITIIVLWFCPKQRLRQQ